ncbi:TPR domain protein [Heterostelium album PN500]|uniref:TPR domain protein n=1 Tax=Heterostelium pallidum (strain ATCC 26659 / Pp 5 / PN500) TaxID=670386 RepID=D3B662_HETP5|nr:TPR domain protein [Heterostelium album PN500]EFA83360.1 TPR domain protein [Heterostelium album PN500]|eukprot:XP_020435477.1 TPR domain protein [Heterostelium album PN500]
MESFFQQSLKNAHSGETDFKQNFLKGQRNPLRQDRNEKIHIYKVQRQTMTQNVGHAFVTTSTTKSSLAKDVTIKPIELLKPVLIKDLVVEKIHHGQVLIARSITIPNKLNAIQVLIEDQNGVYDEILDLSVYNAILPGKKKVIDEIEDMFPIGVIFAVKEPYFKVASSGGLFIRVDDPNDIEFIFDPYHPLICNKQWKKILKLSLPRDVNGWRERGNQYFVNRNFDKALEYYCSGLALDPKHPLLLSNKMAALIELKRYIECIQTGVELLSRQASLVPLSQEKLLIRLGKSYYLVGLYEKSMEIYEKLVKIVPNNNQYPTLIKQCKVRIVERDQGRFDFKAISDAFKSTGEVDCSEYIGPLKMTKTKHGRGLAVTQDVEAGTLLLVSKGVGVYREPEKKDTTVFDVNFKDKVAMNVNSAQVIALVNRQIKANPKLATQVSKLYHDSNPTASFGLVDSLDFFKVNESIVDQVINNTTNIPINVEDVRSIVKLNAFFDDKKIHGLWIVPSFINHDCLPNTSRMFIGDAMIIFSARSFKANDEITTGYCSFLESYEKRKGHHTAFGFTCECQLCQKDRKYTKSEVEQIEKLAEQFQSEFAPKIRKYDQSIIPTIKNNIEVFKKKYGQHLQFDLIHQLSGLSLLYRTKYQDKLSMECLFESLQVSGFTINPINYSRAELPSTPAQFTIQCNGVLQPFYSDIFLQISNNAFNLGLWQLSRETAALSRLNSLIFRGMNTAQHTAEYTGKVEPGVLKFNNDTIKLRNF